MEKQEQDQLVRTLGSMQHIANPAVDNMEEGDSESTSTATMNKPTPPSHASSLPLLPPARIMHQNAIGTIRYTGSLKTRDGIWHGIEWDDADRGKHSGIVDGHQYFTPTKPDSCTFIKASKLGIGGRKSFLDAVVQRYLHDARDVSFKSEKHVVGGGNVRIEARERELMLKEVEVVDVGGMGVGWIGEVEGLNRVKRVGLSRSLIGSVGDVLELLRAVGSLEVLDVCRNVLEGDCGGEVRHGLRELILNHCKVSWEGIRVICGGLRELCELRVYNCGLGGLGDKEEFGRIFERLRVVDLGRNGVCWRDVTENLGRLRELCELYLTGNALGDSEEMGQAAKLGCFGKLDTLGLGDNDVCKWTTVSALHNLPSLRHLRLRGNAVLDVEQGEMTGRMQTIARIGSLKLLDGSSISSDERRHAERKYMRFAFESCNRSLQTAKATHARFEHLLTVYGAIDSQPLHHHGMIHITMRAQNIPCKHPHLTRHIPPHTTFSKLHRTARRLLQIDAPTTAHFENTPETPDPTRELTFWTHTSSNPQLTLVLSKPKN